MKTSSLRKKNVRIDQRKLNRALRILKVRTETEALDGALSVVVSEDKIDTALRKVRGKGRIRKVFE
jgi:Arc/MetJ family transcription regulator